VKYVKHILIGLVSLPISLVIVTVIVIIAVLILPLLWAIITLIWINTMRSKLANIGQEIEAEEEEIIDA